MTKHRSARTGHSLHRVAAAVLAALMLAGAAPLHAEDYDPQEAGHPVRILAYVLHPVGYLLDRLIFRPAHWVGSHEPFRTLFGQREDPY